MPLTDAMRRALSPQLFAFCRFMKEHDLPSPFSAGGKVTAEAFQQFFELPHPIGVSDMTTLLVKLGYAQHVFLVPGFERRRRGKARADWSLQYVGAQAAAAEPIIRTVVDAGRPAPSRIKSVEHELYEQIVVASDDCYPGERERYQQMQQAQAELDLPGLPKNEKEQQEEERQKKWALSQKKELERQADLFAAVLKLPVETFQSDVAEHGLDLPRLCQKNWETLGCAARHIRDFILPGRPWYFCRMSIVRHPEKSCPRLTETLEKSGGLCVFIQDAVKTSCISGYHGSLHTLPGYNLSRQMEYRVIHPFFRRYAQFQPAADLAPVYIPRLHGWATEDTQCSDLFGWRDLAVMVYPIGKKKVTGYFLVAVHPRDIHYFDPLRERISVCQDHDIHWLFSVNREIYRRNHDADADDEIYKKDQPQEKMKFTYLTDEERAQCANDLHRQEMEEEEKQAVRWPGAGTDDFPY